MGLTLLPTPGSVWFQNGALVDAGCVAGQHRGRGGSTKGGDLCIWPGVANRPGQQLQFWLPHLKNDVVKLEKVEK